MAEHTGLGNSFGNYLLHGIDEVILPPAISLMPQTIGWKILALVLCAAILWRIFCAWKNWQRNWYRREGLKVLAEITQRVMAGDVFAASEIAGLIKSVALQAYPRHAVAKLSGEQWLDFLGAQLKDETFIAGSYLLAVAYKPVEQWDMGEEEISKLIASSERWINYHLADSETHHV